MSTNPDIPYHVPALLEEALTGLDIRPDGTYIDATYGGGGHSAAIIKRLESGRLIAFDQDEDALERAVPNEKTTLVLSNFRYITNFLRFHSVDKVDGILADLGVSFHHFDDAMRGFSFRFKDAPLDMRMNAKARTTAADILKNYTAEQLTDIFKNYGELRNAKKLAETICTRRASTPFNTIDNLLSAAAPLINPRQEKKELAQIFQALRIEVNNEMGALKSLLEASEKILKPTGRLVIITYHSIEDRMVKNFMKTGNVEGKVNQDMFGRNLAPFKLITSKPIVPSEQEIENNPRSRSAKLRIAEKI